MTAMFDVARMATEAANIRKPDVTTLVCGAAWNAGERQREIADHWRTVTESARQDLLHVRHYADHLSTVGMQFAPEYRAAVRSDIEAKLKGAHATLDLLRFAYGENAPARTAASRRRRHRALMVLSVSVELVRDALQKVDAP